MVHDFKVDKVHSVIAFSTSYLSYIEWRNSIKHIDFFSLLSVLLSLTKMLSMENFMQSGTILREKIMHFSVNPAHRHS